ncbi:MAG: CBS domain-containing protein [Thermodesulfobacteriota bacterium]|nr:CBS domain-containing protein [Thermodesulfobacteriota bacterium]
MAGVRNKSGSGKIADLLDNLKQRKIPAIYEQASISEIIEAFAGSSHSRLLYVVDQEGRLKGFISLGNLVRHVFFNYHDPYIDTRKLTHMALSEIAAHFMQREPQFALASDDLQSLLQRMIKYNIKEIPIVDDEKRIVADITIVDLLCIA